MNVATAVRSVSQRYRAEGLGGVARAARDRLYERSDFVVSQRDLRTPPPPWHCSVAFELRRIDDETMATFCTMPAPFPRHYAYRTEFRMRHCYGAYVGADIRALMWPLMHADNRRMVNRWRYLLPDEARISNAWAHPSCRGTGLIDACLERLAALFAAAHFRYLYAITWVGNHSSRKLHQRRGYREVAQVYRYTFRWQAEGSGFYWRPPVPRDPIADDRPHGDLTLPDVIPAIDP